jgi:hypothetical protein
VQGCGDPPLLRRQLEQLTPQRERPATRGREQRSDARDGLTLLLLADNLGSAQPSRSTAPLVLERSPRRRERPRRRRPADRGSERRVCVEVALGQDAECRRCNRSLALESAADAIVSSDADFPGSVTGCHVAVDSVRALRRPGDSCQSRHNSSAAGEAPSAFARPPTLEPVAATRRAAADCRTGRSEKRLTQPSACCATHTDAELSRARSLR